ncbi:MAG TPA: DUF459 domain-containing protein [Acidimicrobiales bacterium]|nr:DUF459 domain-containing protein [Acidimicrobiales bacterium]
MVQQLESPAGTAENEPRGRAPWVSVLATCVSAFALWLVLFAPTLEHNALVSPVGTRRTVALDVLRPLAAASRVLQISRIVSETDALTGRTGNRLGDGSAPVRGPVRHPRRSPAGSTPTATTPPSIAHPTAADKLRVLIVGDSLGIDVGGPLQNDLTDTGVVSASLDGRESTGLTRPDYFDWPAELEADLQTFDPQVVVVMIGANDAQDFPGPPDVPFGTARWNAMYASRVASFMEIAQSGGARVVWVGMPAMANPTLSAAMTVIDSIDRQQAAARNPPVAYLSTTTLLGTARGGYSAFITDQAGQVVNVRTPDGTHLTAAGGEVVAQAVIGYMRSTWHVALP